jgi:hypothetical protein
VAWPADANKQAAWSRCDFQPLTDENRGWVAGILEGEGHFAALRVGRPRKDGSHPYRPRAQVGQATREVPDRLVDITGVGRVHGPYKNAGQGYFAWSVQRQVDVDALVCAVFVLLTPRRQEQILRMYDKAAA